MIVTPTDHFQRHIVVVQSQPVVVVQQRWRRAEVVDWQWFRLPEDLLLRVICPSTMVLACLHYCRDRAPCH